MENDSSSCSGGYYRGQLHSCGNASLFFGHVYILSGKTIDVGDDCRFNEGVSLFGRNGCRINIGSRVTFSPGATVLVSGYDTECWMKYGQKTHTICETVIGDDVWICANVTIIGGVHITGHHVIVASGAVVTQDITENYCLYGGIPAKKIKSYIHVDAIAKEDKDG